MIVDFTMVAFCNVIQYQRQHTLLASSLLKSEETEWDRLLGTLALLCRSLWSQRRIYICQHNRAKAETLIFRYVSRTWCCHLDSITFVLDVLSSLESPPHFRKAHDLHQCLSVLPKITQCCFTLSVSCRSQHTATCSISTQCIRFKNLDEE